jgi:YebC/PmpR family DNA-binding regulatory protein
METMSGHSRWSTIKRKKEAHDAKKGKVFTKIAREIMVAARQGGGDPGANPRLRMALTAARAANMPKDNQERAIKKGLGDLDGVTLDEVIYEGRGPRGTAFMVEVVTDNKNRTVSEIRNMFSRAGGELGTGGSVAWMFDKKAVIVIPEDKVGEEALMERVAEAGGEDVKNQGEVWVVTCEPAELAALQAALEDLSPISAGIEYLAKAESQVPVSGGDAVAVAQFWCRLDEHDDVQSVYCNADLPLEIMQEYGP